MKLPFHTPFDLLPIPDNSLRQISLRVIGIIFRPLYDLECQVPALW